jgi:hypothetical protein
LFYREIKTGAEGAWFFLGTEHSTTGAEGTCFFLGTEHSTKLLYTVHNQRRLPIEPAIVYVIVFPKISKMFY